MAMVVSAQAGTTVLQAMGGSARARAKHELHHVIVARARKLADFLWGRFPHTKCSICEIYGDFMGIFSIVYKVQYVTMNM